MTEVLPGDEMFEGAVSLERGDGWVKPWRLPHEELAVYAASQRLAERAEMSTGVRLRFATASRSVRLSVEPRDEPRSFDLTAGEELLATAGVGSGESEAHFDDLPTGEKTLELWLSHHSPTVVRALAVDEGAAASAVADDRPKWTAYGSSITQCRGAHSPGRTWPAIVARRFGLNLTCLGFGGECAMEPMLGVLIRDLPADLVTLKLGINVHGGALSPRTFKAAAMGLVRIIRERHADIPVAVISPIISPPRETDGGATGLTLEQMRDDLADAVRRLESCGDGNLHYFDGRELFGEELVAERMPDLLHPDADGIEILGENVCRLVMPDMAPTGS